MSTAILVGALVVGDSVRYSLQKIVLDRLGTTEFVLLSGDRYFRMELANELTQSLETLIAPVLKTQGIAVAEGGQKRLNHINVIGVDARFGAMGEVPEIFDHLLPGEAIINRPLASELGLTAGDEFLLRVGKLDLLPRDIPFAVDTKSMFVRRMRVRSIASSNEFGNFQIKSNQVAPYNVFVSLTFLSGEMGLEGRANGLLISENSSIPLNIQSINDAFRQVWTLEDANLELIEQGKDLIIELRSGRLFLDQALVEAAKKIDENVQPVMTYFVNDIGAENRSTPYSFVSAPGKPIVPSDMRDDEIIITDWLARDLNVQRGDQIVLTFYTLGPMQALIEESAIFRVKSIIPINTLRGQDFLPQFPGLVGEENCRDWDPGVEMDLGKIRDKDEAYWDQYGGIPKAFVTLHAAQEMWRNRFGESTGIQFHHLEKHEIRARLKKRIDPALIGFVFRNIKGEGLRAGEQSVDFSRLFLGLSFFIIVAALLLTALLFVFGVETRSKEHGILLALGFEKKTIKGFIFGEGAILLIMGGMLGGVVGILYNQILLFGLKTVWHGAVGTSVLNIHVKWSTMVFGIFLGVVMALFAIGLASGKQVQESISGLQRGLTRLELKKGKHIWISIISCTFSLMTAIILLVMPGSESSQDRFFVFFTAGLLLLVGGVTFVNIVLYHLGRQRRDHRFTAVTLGVQNTVRRRTRSVTLVGLLASGLFIIFTVGANRKSVLMDSSHRESGTGGFALFGETTVPILHDLNTKKGRQFYGLEETVLHGVRSVQFRVKEGDDASCLNLNRVSTPRLIGVNPDELGLRGAFTFLKTTPEADPENPWSVLKQNLSNNTIPGIADETVIVWGLGKTVGDTLTYIDERGEIFNIQLVGGIANSIFQGNIIISEDAFIQKYPSISGYRLLLLDAPSDHLEPISETFLWALRDQGLDLTPTARRLAEFNRVQNTYLSIFLFLGSFGLILGSIGLGIVVWRNVNEQRSELALLRAIGFRRQLILKILLSEHIIVMLTGIFFGIVSAFLATLPSMKTSGSEIPYFTLLFFFILVVANGLVWITLATHKATAGDLLPALRKE